MPEGSCNVQSRFMRSTFCSRKKLGMDSETLKNRIPVPARRRALRPHGDTGNINVKDCNSECNVSKFSCNMKRSADCETDYSRSDYDIKTDVFPVLNVLRSSCHHKAQPTNNGSNRHGRKLLGDNSKRFLKVDEWLHLHKNGERTSDHPQKSRGIQAIPEKSRCGVSNYEHKKKYHGKTKNLMDARRAQSFTSETTNEITPVPFKDSFDEVTEKILVSLKELFDEDSTCSPNSTHLSHKFDDHAVTRKEDCLLCLMHRENEHSLFSSDNMHKDNIINQDSCRKIETRVLQVAREGEARGITLSRNGSSHSSTSDIENKADMVKKSHENISMSEQESRNHQVQIHVEMKNYENGVLQTTQDLHGGMIPSQHRVAHQTALSTETDNQENSAMFSQDGVVAFNR